MKIKKFICLMLALLLVTSSYTFVPAFAADTASVTLSSAECRSGEIVEIDVILSDCAPINTMGLTYITYDESVLSLISGEWTNKGPNCDDYDLNMQYMFNELADETDVDANGKIATLRFEAIGNPGDSSEIGITASLRSMECEGYDTLPVTVVNGRVTIVSNGAEEPEVPEKPTEYDEPVVFGLYVGGWGNVGTATVSKPGTYTITASNIDGNDWVIVKNAAGEDKPTSIPAGTIIRTTEIKLNGEVMTFDGGADHIDFTVGANGTIEMVYYLTPNFNGKDHFDNRPATLTSVEVTFVVDPDAVAENPEEPEVPEPPEPSEPNVATGYFMMYEGEAPGDWNVANYRFEDGCKTKGESWDMVNITDLVKEAAGGDLSKVIAVDVALTADGLEKFPSWHSNADQTPVVEYRAYTADNVSATLASVSRADNTSNTISLHAAAYHGLDNMFCVKVRGIEAVAKEDPVKVIVTVKVTTDENGPYVPPENTVYCLYSVPVQGGGWTELINGSTYGNINAFNSALIATNSKGVMEYTLDKNTWGQVHFNIKVPAHNPANPEEVKDAELTVSIGIDASAGSHSLNFDYDAIYSRLISKYYTEGGEDYKPGTAYDNQWSGANNYIFDELPEDYVVTLSNVIWQTGEPATVTKVEIAVPDKPEQPEEPEEPADLPEPVEVGLYIGGNGADATVIATKYNTEYEIVFEGSKSVGNWIFVKATSNDSITGLADGTVVEITSCVVDGVTYPFKAGDSYTFEIGKTFGGEDAPGKLETALYFAWSGDSNLASPRPENVDNEMVVKFKIIEPKQPEQPEDPSDDNVIILFESEEGAALAANPWDTCGVGKRYGGDVTDFYPSWDEVKKLIFTKNAKVEFEYSGDGSSAPGLYLYDFKPDGGYKMQVAARKVASANLSEVLANFLASGKTEEDVRSFLLQPNISNFRLYSAKVILPVSEDSLDDNVIVLFESKEGAALAANPWDTCGVGKRWGGNVTDFDVSWDEVKELIFTENATVVFEYSGNGSSAPNLYLFDFEPEYKMQVTSGNNVASANLSDVLGYFYTSGKTEKDVRSFLLQPNISNFRLYSAKIILPNPEEPGDEPEAILRADIPNGEVDMLFTGNFTGVNGNTNFRWNIETRTLKANNSDGVAFTLPEKFRVGETVTVHIKGYSDIPVRAYLSHNNGGSNGDRTDKIYSGTLTDGQFDIYMTFEVGTQNGEDPVTSVVIKGDGGNLANTTFTLVTLVPDDDFDETELKLTLANGSDNESTIKVDHYGTYTVSIKDRERTSYDWLVLKCETAANLPVGTVITTKSLVIDGKEYVDELNNDVMRVVIKEDKSFEILYYVPYKDNFTNGHPSSIEDIQLTFAVSSPFSVRPVLSDKIGFEYAIRIDGIEPGVKPVAAFEINGRTQTSVCSDSSADGIYYFMFDEIYPSEAADTVNISVTADGKLIAEDKTASVRNYCKAVIDSSLYDDVVKNLVSDMLAYCDAAETYANGSSTIADYLATPSNHDITCESIRYISDESIWRGASLLLDNRIALRFFAQDGVDLSRDNIKVTVDGVETDDFRVTYSTQNKATCVEVAGFGPLHYGKPVVVTMIDSGASITFNVESFIKLMSGSTDYPTVATLVQELYDYSVSAKAYSDVYGK